MPPCQPGLSEVTKEFLKGTEVKDSGNREEEDKKESGKQGKPQLWRVMLPLFRPGWVSVSRREQ